MNDKKCVKLDLYIDDEEILHQSNDESADEVLCLRILSSQTKYRFGGLKVHIESPVFNVGKIFNVEFDEDSEVALIKGQKDAIDDHNVCLEHNTPTTSKAATIVISPDREDLSLNKSSTVSADLTLIEITDSKAEMNANNDNITTDESGGSRRGSSTQFKKFVSKKLQSSWNNAIRVKRFFSDSMTLWN